MIYSKEDQELIRQLIELLPYVKLDTRFLWNEFKTEIKRLNNLENIMIKKQKVDIEQTQHNTGKFQLQSISRSDFEMIQDYLLHILKFETSEERVNILRGVKTLFQLKAKTITIMG